MPDDKISPIDGGCWFCYTQSEKMSFSIEFDTYFHLECLKAALEKSTPEQCDEEAEIIGREFDLC